MGVCASEGRITICHKNVPTVLSKITSVMGEAGVNISDMTNKSRNDYAYTIIDLDSAGNTDLIEKLEAIEGVIRARVIK